jgi:hypothetical protein
VRTLLRIPVQLNVIPIYAAPADADYKVPAGTLGYILERSASDPE